MGTWPFPGGSSNDLPEGAFFLNKTNLMLKKFLLRRLTRRELACWLVVIILSAAAVIGVVLKTVALQQQCEGSRANSAVLTAQIRLYDYQNEHCTKDLGLKTLLKRVADRVEGDGYVFGKFVIYMKPDVIEETKTPVVVKSLETGEAIEPTDKDTLTLPPCLRTLHLTRKGE